LDYHSVDTLFSQPNFALLLAITPTGTTILVFLLTVLFIISFLVAGSEVAFFSMTYKDINMLKTHQQPAYRRIVTLLEQPKTLLASMLITNSFVNIGIILIANTLIDGLVPGLDTAGKPWAIFLVKVLLVTIFLILFAEVLPKVWATHQKLRFASTASLLIEICNSIFYRLSKRLVRFTDRVERRFSTEKNTALDSSHLDDAIDLLPEHEATMEEKQILKGIRKFGDTTVRQVMRTRLDVSGIAHGSNFADVITRVEELHYSRLPVYKNNLDEIAGLLHTKDLLPHLQEPAGFNWHSLVRPAIFVHEQKLIEDLMQEFRNRHIHFAVVVDEFGGTSGIITLEDIMEEIIGDIKDEFDDEENINRKIDDNTYLFEGKTMINDVCKAMQLPADTFEEARGESDSLAGLVLEIAGEFPQVNEEIQKGDFIFVPLDINKNRIERIKVIIRPQEN
jgi:putative hemolysin